MKVTFAIFIASFLQLLYASDFVAGPTAGPTVGPVAGPNSNVARDGYYWAQDCTVNGCVWGEHKSWSPDDDKQPKTATAPVSACGPIGAGYKANDESSELIAAIFAGSVSSDFCSPAGKELPASMSTWWTALKTYSAAEKARRANFDGQINEIKKQMDAITSDKSGTRDLQTEGNKLQIKLTNITIQNITERIKLRTALYNAGNKAMKANASENTANYVAYKDSLISLGLETALSIANDACKRTKKEKVCTDEADPETCKIEDVPAPVAGCKEAQKLIPAIRTGKVQEYGEVYLDMSGPSKDLNERMGKLEDAITSLMKAVPASAEADYNWTKPMIDGINVMIKARKNAGVICKMDKKKISEAANKFEDATADMSSEKLISTFNLADMLIGQPYKRADYIEYFTEHINYINCFDEEERMVAQDNMTKLIEFGSKVASIGAKPAAGGAGGSGGASGSGGATAPAVPTVNSGGAGGASTSPFVIGGSSSGANTAVGSATSSATTETKKSAVASKTSDSTVTSLNEAITAKRNAEILQSKFQTTHQAISFKTKDENNKANSGFSVLISPNKAKGSDSSKKAPATNLMKNEFDKMNAIKESDHSSNLKSNGPAASHSFDKTDESQIANLAPKGSSGSGSRSYESNEGVSSSTRVTRSSETFLGYSSPSNRSSSSGSTSSSSSNSSSSQSNSEDRSKVAKGVGRDVSEESRTLTQSIEAKNTISKRLYEPNETDSLFDRLTKAYIRNYEKVSN